MTSAEICVAGVVWTLYMDDKTVDVENDHLSIWQRLGKLRQFVKARQLNVIVSNATKEVCSVVKVVKCS